LFSSRGGTTVPWAQWSTRHCTKSSTKKRVRLTAVISVSSPRQMADINRLFPDFPQKLFLWGLRKEIGWRLAAKDRQLGKLKNHLKRAISKLTVLTKIKRRYEEEFQDYDALHDLMREGMTAKSLQRTEEFLAARNMRWT